jgi:hypothetical protein
VRVNVNISRNLNDDEKMRGYYKCHDYLFLEFLNNRYLKFKRVVPPLRKIFRFIADHHRLIF